MPTILLIDDHSYNLFILESLLKTFGVTKIYKALNG